MSSPFFSIIVPVYNVAPYLRECLDSVLAQTYPNWECLCVDDGSTDESGAILDEYAQKDPRFRIFHKKNGGVSVARNLALDNAKGEWIGFLDSDDVWAPEWLDAIVYETQLEPRLDWIHIESCREWDETKAPLSSVRPTTKRFYVGENTLLADAWKVISRNSVPWLNFYRRDCIQSVRFMSGIRFREDALYLYEASFRIRMSAVINCFGYSQRIRAASATTSPRHRTDTINLLSSYLTLWKHHKKELRQYLQINEIRNSSTYWIIKDVRQWFQLCPDRNYLEGLKVYALVWKLVFYQACNLISEGTLFGRLRWLVFLMTGYGKILSFTRLSFKRLSK